MDNNIVGALRKARLMPDETDLSIAAAGCKTRSGGEQVYCTTNHPNRIVSIASEVVFCNFALPPSDNDAVQANERANEQPS